MIDLTVPVRGASFAASHSPADRATIVALHGASEGTRQFDLYEHLHARLPALGIGVVTYDRRGEGQSTGEPSVGRFDVQAEDALALLHVLDVDCLVVWGFSQGAWIAPIVTVKEPRVACMVGIASTGVTPAEQMLYGVAEHMRRAQFDASSISEAVALRRAFDDAIHGRVPESVVDQLLQQASHEPWWPLAHLPRTLPDALGRASWIDEMDFDPIPSFRALQVPVLLFYGEEDEWTPVEDSISAWESAQRENATIVVIPEVGHGLRGRDGEVSSLYEDQLLAWLDQTLPA